jgi:hypothetical protein
MWEGIASAVVGLAASVCIGAIAFGRWMPQPPDQTLARNILSSGRADRWSHATSLLLLAALDRMLGRKMRRSRDILRSVTSASAILLLALSLAGVLSGTFLGFKESPWGAYDKTIERLSKSNDGQVVQRDDEQTRVAISAQLRGATAPHWKYIYSVSAILVTSCIYLAAFFLSGRAVRRWMLEMDGAHTWMQKAGIACLATIALLFWTTTLVLVFAFFSSPIPILAVSLAHLASPAWIVAGAIAVAVFEFFVSGPWFKALLLASVLPGAAFVLTTLLPLALDLTADAFSGVRRQAVKIAHERLGQALIPLCMTLGAIACLLWFLRVLL